MSRVTERSARAGVDKFSIKRRELADSALAVIAEHGFANTGLRDMAARADLSHGVLHYYFDGKDDLIGQAIWQYKSECARRYDTIVETAQSPSELAERFSEAMAATLRDESDMHRLWYDLRNQALFTDGFRDTIIAIDGLLSDMVWIVVERYAELSNATVRIDRADAYALFDGLFLNCMIGYLRGELDSIDRLRASSARLLTAAI